MPSTQSKLHDAAAGGSVERTVALLSGGSVDIDGSYGDAGRTPLMVASTMGYLRFVRVLLRLGAGVSVADNTGATALHLSVFNKHLAVSKALVKAGADVEALGVDGVVSEGEEVGVLGSYMYGEGEGGRARSYRWGWYVAWLNHAETRRYGGALPFVLVFSGKICCRLNGTGCVRVVGCLVLWCFLQ